MDWIVVDIETTGLKPEESELIEIGAIRIRDNRVIQEFSELIKPRESISAWITNLTGITNEMVQDAPNEQEVLGRFLSFIEGSNLLIGHNIDKFDLPFINKRLSEHGLETIPMRTRDTLTLAQQRISFRKINDFKLGTIAAYFGINNKDAHRAFNDATMVWNIHGKLINHPDESEKCPRCNNILRKMNGKFGPFIGCSGYPNCRYTEKL